MKKVVLPIHIKEEAEAFADEAYSQRMKRASSEKDRGTALWKKYFDNYVLESYNNSLIPATGNPSSPIMPPDVVQAAYPEIFGPGGFLAKHLDANPGSAIFKKYEERITSAVNNLTNIFAQLEMGFKTRKIQGEEFDVTKKATLTDFQFPKKDANTTPEDSLKILSARYYRYLINNIVYEALIPTLFETKEQDVIDFVHSLNITSDVADRKKLVAELLNKDYIKKYIKYLREKVNSSILKKMNFRSIYF